MSPLNAQRFSGLTPLENCLNGTHKLQAGEPDRTSVDRVQSALVDFGYAVAGGIDGIFGPGTGAAVTAFKTDEGLSPTDPVIGVGTMTRLDDHFAHEQANPDAPDPSTTGLVQLGKDTITNICVPRLDAVIAKLDQPVLDPLVNDALERNFHVSSHPLGRQAAIDQVIRPTFKGTRNVLAASPPVIVLKEMDRATFVAQDVRHSYSVAMMTTGSVFSMTPAFRNALGSEDHVTGFIRAAVTISLPGSSVQGFPGTARYAALTGDEALKNRIAYAAFAFEVTTGIFSTLRPFPEWF
ncbi:peptidoglycan-binding protein [Streptomyces sp. NPDC051907]|uniref:peptidoglycan-binding domain-containing protein n=1 Tax=Streptomyces sp. NPDC051907 TaxID=3155284 RepID=UPI0034255323